MVTGLDHIMDAYREEALEIIDSLPNGNRTVKVAAA